MKKIIIAMTAVLAILSVSGCSDMLETDSTNQQHNPTLNEKTDSVFYAFGIMQAMQQLADHYVFQNEMRGDLVKTTQYTDKNLRQLYTYSATKTNAYDSTYVYYRVINNCNYYIAHRDTTLLTGSTNVVRNEYAAVKAFRAWAYLQLGKNYERVPFFTTPLTTISQIEGNKFPLLTLDEIIDRLTPDLEQYSGLTVPNYGAANYAVGSTNWGRAKTINTSLCFIPIDVILGELYLERGNYDKAASHYTTYLTKVAAANTVQTSYSAPFQIAWKQMDALPSDFVNGSTAPGTAWGGIFTTANSVADIITYIPMAVNYRNGVTTKVPKAFGFNYYATKNNIDELYIDEIQVQPSAAYLTLSDTADYFYSKETTTGIAHQATGSFKAGDMRAHSILRFGEGADSTKVWVRKYTNGNIILYRNTTILLHLAEALNRLGHPDAAFAILKDGLSANIINYATYLTNDSKQLLQSTYPLLSPAYQERFATNQSFGVHMHGGGVCWDRSGDGYASYTAGLAPYQLDSIVGNKMAQIKKNFHVAVGITKADSINAMEDLLCDEYALELAFEGNRWGDLTRLARHKNLAALYGSDYGTRWLNAVIKRAKGIELSGQKHWYLPFN